MYVITFFVPHTQASLIEQPIEGCLYHIAESAKAAAMWCVAFCYHRFNATLSQRFADLLLGIVSAIRKHFIRPFARATSWLLDWWNCIDQWQSHFGVMDICTRVIYGQRSTLSINNQMAFRAILAPIRGIRAGSRPPKTARTEQLSIAEQDQSIASANPSSSSRDCHIFCQTPAACQSRRRRQQVMPLPQPISLGRYSHGIPLLSTNRMPVRQARSGVGGRPPLGLGGRAGMCGLMRCHSSSVSSGLAIITSSMTSGHNVRTSSHIGETTAQSLGFVRVPKFHRKIP
jgi:hypothetical protein